MTVPYLRLIRGDFVVVGKSPDGDSVRFVAARPALFKDLHRAERVKITPADGSVQLRLEGIDTPELHYGTAAQPQGRPARDALLTVLGFASVTDSGPPHYVVASARPTTRPGAILASGVDPNGRVVAYTVDPAAVTRSRDGAWVRVTPTVLGRTSSHQQTASGAAYYTVYTSTPAEHRTALRRAAAAARAAKRGVWADDATGDFRLTDPTSVGPDGALILPKLFRRCIDYLKAVDGGFRGELADWMRSTGGTARPENDRVLVRGVEVTFADLLRQQNDRISLAADVLDLVFIEK